MMDGLARDARDVGPLPDWETLVFRWLARQRRLLELERGNRPGVGGGRVEVYPGTRTVERSANSPNAKTVAEAAAEGPTQPAGDQPARGGQQVLSDAPASAGKIARLSPTLQRLLRAFR